MISVMPVYRESTDSQVCGELVLMKELVNHDKF